MLKMREYHFEFQDIGVNYPEQCFEGKSKRQWRRKSDCSKRRQAQNAAKNSGGFTTKFINFLRTITSYAISHHNSPACINIQPNSSKKGKKNDEYTTNETVLYFDSNEKRMLDAIVVGKASVKVNRIINNDGHCFHININHLAKKITTENHCWLLQKHFCYLLCEYSQISNMRQST